MTQNELVSINRISRNSRPKKKKPRKKPRTPEASDIKLIRYCF